MQQIGRYEHIVVKPITGALGAEIEGVDLSKPLAPPVLDEIKRAFSDHLCIFFRDQDLDVESFGAFGSNFGELGITSYVDPVHGATKVHRIVREASATWDDRNFGDSWHIDQTTRPNPNPIFGLYSVEVPEYGGDTMFANLYMAYEKLSPALQKICDQLYVMHSASGLYGADGMGGPGLKKPMSAGFHLSEEEKRAYLMREQRHPLVIRHPVTGRKSLYTAGAYCKRFDGMTEDESMPLIDYLYRHAGKPEFTCRFHWTKGAVAIMDNRSAMHFAVQDYSGVRREMLRLEVAGEDVIAAAAPANEAAAESVAA